MTKIYLVQFCKSVNCTFFTKHQPQVAGQLVNNYCVLKGNQCIFTAKDFYYWIKETKQIDNFKSSSKEIL
jgi:hypothetical protein